MNTQSVQEQFYQEYVGRVHTVDSGKVTLYGPHPKYWEVILETITESLHQSLDGWEPDEVKVIERYIEDIERAAQITFESR